MKTIILGAGIIGISTAWHLRARGHDVIVIDRQAEAAQETSFANAGQISVSYCEPWANREAPLKARSLHWPRNCRPHFHWSQSSCGRNSSGEVGENIHLSAFNGASRLAQGSQ